LTFIVDRDSDEEEEGRIYLSSKQRILVFLNFTAPKLMVARTAFSSVGWTFHISWWECCLYVCLITRVAQIVTAAHRDL